MFGYNSKHKLHIYLQMFTRPQNDAWVLFFILSIGLLFFKDISISQNSNIYIPFSNNAVAISSPEKISSNHFS